MPCESQGFRCKSAHLGAYSLDASQLARIKTQRDFRPNDEERDEIIDRSHNWLMEAGFSRLSYKTQYFET